jgi:muramidase (phage lysozyme)
MSAGIAMTREYNNQVQQEEAASDNPKEFLDLIAKGEGTLEALGFRGYNESYGYGAYTGGDRELTSMTIKEIRDLQREMLADPNNSRNSSALGRYQIVGTTLEGLINSLGLTGEERFDEQMQDMLATELLEQRGLSRYRAGNIDETRFMNNLAQEWASFPRGDGSANYPDQPLGLTQNEARVGLGILRGF